jgi:hypothetical protein
MLTMSYQQRNIGTYPENRRTWEATIGWAPPEPDPVVVQLAQIIAAIENICLPTIQNIAP